MRRHFNVISTATTQFSGTPDRLTLAPTPSDYVEHHEVQTGSSNNLATETDIDAISVAIPMFWGKVFTGIYVDFARHFLPPEIPNVCLCLRREETVAIHLRHKLHRVPKNM